MATAAVSIHMSTHTHTHTHTHTPGSRSLERVSRHVLGATAGTVFFLSFFFFYEVFTHSEQSCSWGNGRCVSPLFPHFFSLLLSRYALAVDRRVLGATKGVANLMTNISICILAAVYYDNYLYPCYLSLR